MFLEVRGETMTEERVLEMEDETDMTRIDAALAPDPVFPQIRAAADWRKRNAARFTAAAENDLERSDPDVAQLTQEWLVDFCETNGRSFDGEPIVVATDWNPNDEKLGVVVVPFLGDIEVEDQTADCAIGGLEELLEDHEDPNAWIISFFETTSPRVVVPDPVTETGMTLWVPIITPALELERAMSDGFGS